MGRRIFDNLKKAMAYIFAIHVPIAGMSLLPLIFGWPLVFLPVHIVFLELIIDPACSVVFESERAERDVMLRPPRRSKDSLFGKKIIGLSLLQGLRASSPSSWPSFSSHYHEGREERMHGPFPSARSLLQTSVSL